MKIARRLGMAAVVMVSALLVSCECEKKPAAEASAPAAGAPEVSGADDSASEAAGVPILTEYGTEWCPPCKQTAKLFAEIRPAYEGRLVIKTVDVDKNRGVVETLHKIGFKGHIPFLVLRSADGDVLWTKTGYVPRAELEKVLKENGVTSTD